MFRYIKKHISILSLIISISIILIINLFYFNIYQVNSKDIEEVVSSIDVLQTQEVQKNEKNTLEDVNVLQSEDNNAKVDNIKDSEQEKQIQIKKDIVKEDIFSQWYLEIPTINLKAEIQEGTTSEVMKQYIGHFTETEKTEGNVGLAAHNRGYEKNYFENLKNLKVGDSIFYKCDVFSKEYMVTEHCIIKDTDWTYLEESDKNLITLITCVENRPEYRRCIRGQEKVEK